MFGRIHQWSMALDFSFWNIFDYWSNIFICYWSVHVFLFLLESVLADCMFLDIYFFLIVQFVGILLLIIVLWYFRKLCSFSDNVYSSISDFTASLITVFNRKTNKSCIFENVWVWDVRQKGVEFSLGQRD